MKKKRKLGVGILGACAGISHTQYIPAIKQNPHLEIQAVMDISHNKLKTIADQCGCDAYNAVDDVLGRKDIDIIVITTPDSLHCKQTVKAANASKHILSTKPLALSLKEGRIMRDAVRKSGIIFMCGMNVRYSSWAQTVKTALNNEDIGKPVFVRYISKGNFYSYPKGHFYRKAASGGQLLHNGAHYLDSMSYWINSLPNSVYGVSTSCFSKNDRLETDNYYNISLTFNSGALGHFEYNQLLVNPRGYPTAKMISIIGTKGMIEISVDDSRSVELYSEGKLLYPSPAYSIIDNCGFDCMINDFTDAVLRKKKSPIPIEHSLRILEVCLKGLESCNSQKPLTILN